MTDKATLTMPPPEEIEKAYLKKTRTMGYMQIQIRDLEKNVNDLLLKVAQLEERLNM